MGVYWNKYPGWGISITAVIVTISPQPHVPFITGVIHRAATRREIHRHDGHCTSGQQAAPILVPRLRLVRGGRGRPCTPQASARPPRITLHGRTTDETHCVF